MSESDYIPTAAFGEDFWKAFLEKPKVIRWLVKILVGRYAWNELVGIKKSYEENCLGITKIRDIGYGLEKCEYHKELDKYKDW
jgi:hypothetical protein